MGYSGGMMRYNGDMRYSKVHWGIVGTVGYNGDIVEYNGYSGR